MTASHHCQGLEFESGLRQGSHLPSGVVSCLPRSLETTTIVDWQRTLRDLMPPKVALRCAADAPADFKLTDGELACCARFSAKRLADFRVGRYCARDVLSQLGEPGASVTIGDSREPVWPDGIVGSIAHTTGIAGAVGAYASEYRALGLDIEHAQPLAAVSEHICTQRELVGPTSRVVGDDYLGAVFSAKEAVYKCIFPLVRRFVGFKEVEIEFAAAETFSVVWHDDVHDALSALQGRWRRADGVTMALAFLPALGCVEFT